ncbi:SIR2 family protein [Pseudoxanthomonas mexicana]|uniref:SIR2 family protein n=1 Tax=Pseudoxanthomonas mexicana TaxID=128785 RepID=UPI0028ACE9D7|nr:SIR2 family protein [Pseudoxanthomonas mexicana]
MSIELSHLVSDLTPERTVLFFGAGASIPSGAPTVERLIKSLADRFKIDADGLSLKEISTLVEKKVSNRRELVATIRPLFKNIRPTGGLLNVPLFKWKGLYTTNYDTLVEQAFKLKAQPLTSYSSNFDFSQPEVHDAQKLFKVHGSIEKDVVDGVQSRLIISEDDYDLTAEYREKLYNRLKADIDNARLVVIGNSLADTHIKEIVNWAIRVNSEGHNHRSVTFVSYQKDDNRASLLENKGFQVTFGGVDEFFAELAKKAPESVVVRVATGDPLDAAPVLQPVTRSVVHALGSEDSNVGSMFNGWPAKYADIKAGLTFERSIVSEIDRDLDAGQFRHVVIVGASGVGKTTAARQLMIRLSGRNHFAWEHDVSAALLPDAWKLVAERLGSDGARGFLFIDEASSQINEVNKLVDLLHAKSLTSLSLVLVSAKSAWAPRIKSPYIYRYGREFNLRRLDGSEVDRLLSLVDNSGSIRALVEASFKGFSRYERRRRLVERCESDFFVCLRNVFASEKFDDIILREYAALNENSRNVYKLVAALQSAGVSVHRQLVIRLLSIPSIEIVGLLASLSDVVLERTIDQRQGIYGWVGRHQVISEIITRYKFSDQDALYDLISRVIEESSPTYQLEVRSLRELCASEYGIPRITDRKKQNVLYRMIMSVVPGERVPRHRLIRNLIRLGEFEEAATEIRIFESDFREEGPIARYKIDLMLARAEHSPGILDEDRVAILREATAYASTAISRFGDNKYVLNAYAQVGVRWFKYTGKPDVFDAALDLLREAEERLADPEISSMITRATRVFTAAPTVLDAADALEEVGD